MNVEFSKTAGLNGKHADGRQPDLRSGEEELGCELGDPSVAELLLTPETQQQRHRKSNDCGA